MVAAAVAGVHFVEAPRVQVVGGEKHVVHEGDRVEVVQAVMTPQNPKRSRNRLEFFLFF